jgi:AcrR family transcriptional regulator
MTLIDVQNRVLPAKQARSRETRDRLLSAGRRLLEQGAFEDTSIADIAGEAGCSVGAFYHRFSDKEAFFKVLVEVALAEVAAEAKSTLTLAQFSDAALDDVLEACVTYWINQLRRNRGLLRTVMKKTLHSSDAWTPLRQMGLEVVEHLVGLVAAKCDKQDSRTFHYRAMAGFQFVSSMALNASLHETMMFNIDSRELVPWSTEVLRHCLFGELPPHLLSDLPAIEFGADRPSRA